MRVIGVPLEELFLVIPYSAEFLFLRKGRVLAALAVVLGAGLIGSAPARADHGPDFGFSFSFGFPAPVIPVPVPVVQERVYYGPPVVYHAAPPVYYAPRVHYSRTLPNGRKRSASSPDCGFSHVNDCPQPGARRISGRPLT